MSIPSEIDKFRTYYRLKQVYRYCKVEERKESSAEHTWSCLMLADFFMSIMNTKLDKIKVYEMLMYHDIVEIEAGDAVLHPDNNNHAQQENEFEAMRVLKQKIPEVQAEKFEALFKEFEERKTPEARFAKAIDKLDAHLHELDYKEDWKGWTEEFLRKNKQKYYEEFPEIMEAFEYATKYSRERGYFDQK